MVLVRRSMHPRVPCEARRSGRALTLAPLVLLVVTGCARGGPSTATGEGSRAPASSAAPPAIAAETMEPSVLLARGEAALAEEDAARAVALLGRYLSLAVDAANAENDRRAYLGLGRAHELLRDCAAAVRAYGAFLARFADGADRTHVLARQGACQAELGRWEGSAASFGEISETANLLPSVHIEVLARRGYALFMLAQYAEADASLAQADVIYERAMVEQSERFSSYYFVGMARFYRAAIIHVRFREVRIELPQKVMARAFKKRMELLMTAQDAYNHTIRAKHVFWVSAAGYQLGHLLSEMYDALMYAPVPKWLDEKQRVIYYDELKKQLEPIVTKAIWVFEKNLETARRLGYDSPFIEQTEVKLGHLQRALASDEAGFGTPQPRLAAQGAQGPEPQAPSPNDGGGTAADRKLFVPPPMPL